MSRGQCVFAHNSTKKSRTKVARVTLHTSSMVKRSKVKVTRRINTVTDNQPYLRRERPANFKVGTPMDQKTRIDEA